MGLPREILRTRILNEVKMCQEALDHKITLDDPNISEFPTTLRVHLKNTPGPLRQGVKVTTVYEHRMLVEIGAEYPYQKPIVRWETEIFHPNIVPPERGGWVCIKLLDNWNFSSNLLSFIHGIESMLANPNPLSPYDDRTTLEAARYFAKQAYKPITLVVRGKSTDRD